MNKLSYGFVFGTSLLGATVLFYAFFGLIVPYVVVELMKPSLQEMVDIEFNKQASDLMGNALRKELEREK